MMNRRMDDRRRQGPMDISDLLQGRNYVHFLHYLSYMSLYNFLIIPSHYHLHIYGKELYLQGLLL